MEFIKTKTSDKLIYTGLLSKPVTPTNKIIIHIHGMSGDIYIDSWFSEMHKEYPKNNLAFLVGENRGTHSITQFLTTDEKIVNIGNAFEKFEDCVLDIQSWVDKAVSLDYTEIWLQGHSLGCSKIAYYLYKQNPINIKGIILMSPADMLGCFMGITKNIPVVEIAEDLIAKGMGTQLITHKDLEEYLMSANSIVNFFSRDSNLAIFNFANPELGFKVVNSLNVPVLAFTGTKDGGIWGINTHSSAMEILEEQLINCPKKKTIIYTNAEHSFEGFEENIIKDVLEFILV